MKEEILPPNITQMQRLIRENCEQLYNKKLYVCAQLLSSVQLFVTPWTTACEAPLSMEFSRQEYWSHLPFPTPRYLSNPGINPLSLASCVLPHCANWEATPQIV